MCIIDTTSTIGTQNKQPLYLHPTSSLQPPDLQLILFLPAYFLPGPQIRFLLSPMSLILFLLIMPVPLFPSTMNTSSMWSYLLCQSASNTLINLLMPPTTLAKSLAFSQTLKALSQFNPLRTLIVLGSAVRQTNILYVYYVLLSWWLDGSHIISFGENFSSL